MSIIDSPITKIFEDTGTKLQEAINFEETIKTDSEINSVLGINILTLIFIIYRENTLEFLQEMQENAKDEFDRMIKLIAEREHKNGR